MTIKPDAAVANPPLPGAMPGRTPENAPQPADFAPKDLAKALLRATRAGTLATLDRNTGHPFASLVNVATDVDGSPLILVSRLATHTANLECDARASLLLADTGKGDALGASAPDRAGQLQARRARSGRRAAPAAAVSRPPSEVGTLCRISPTSASGAWTWSRRISTAASPAPPT